MLSLEENVKRYLFPPIGLTITSLNPSANMVFWRAFALIPSTASPAALLVNHNKLSFDLVPFNKIFFSPPMITKSIVDWV